MPRLFSASTPGESALPDVLVIVVLISLITAAIVWVVRFALHNVFVIGVLEPIWSRRGTSIEQVWGPNLFLVSHQPIADGPTAASYCEVDLAHAPVDQSQHAGWFDEQFARQPTRS